MLFRRRADRQIETITERIRAVLSRQPGHNLRAAADSLELSELDLARVLDSRGIADTALLIEVIAALAYQAGVDPQWLLTGEYDGAIHRHVLMLGEDRGTEGKRAVRDFVHRQYLRVRREALLSWRPGRARQRRRQTRHRDAVRSA